MVVDAVNNIFSCNNNRVGHYLLNKSCQTEVKVKKRLVRSARIIMISSAPAILLVVAVACFATIALAAEDIDEILISSGGSRHRLPMHRRLLVAGDFDTDVVDAVLNSGEQSQALLRERILKPKKKDKRNTDKKNLNKRDKKNKKKIAKKKPEKRKKRSQKYGGGKKHKWNVWKEKDTNKWKGNDRKREGGKVWGEWEGNDCICGGGELWRGRLLNDERDAQRRAKQDPDRYPASR